MIMKLKIDSRNDKCLTAKVTFKIRKASLRKIIYNLCDFHELVNM